MTKIFPIFLITAAVAATVGIVSITGYTIIHSNFINEPMPTDIYNTKTPPQESSQTEESPLTEPYDIQPPSNNEVPKENNTPATTNTTTPKINVPTEITAEATSASGTNITIKDTTLPKINAQADITVEATSTSGAIASYDITAIDLIDRRITASCIPASGSTFPFGKTAVTCKAEDRSKNLATSTFNVTVQDTTAPKINVPADIVKEAASPSGSVISYSTTAADSADGTIEVSCTPASGSTFPFGKTTVTCTSRDSHLNPANATFKITVRDTLAPVLTLNGDETVNISAGATYSDAGATASDTVYGNITSDIVINNQVNTSVPGTYAITYNIMDAAGNHSPEKTRTVIVKETLGRNASTNIDSKITNVTEQNASLYKNIFSTQDHDNSIYIRNTSSWAYGINLTALSPWNSDFSPGYPGNMRAGTLISPRHIIFANHFLIPDGKIIRFVTSDNEVVERTLVSSSRVGATDLQIGVLDSDVPSTIGFAKVLPNDWQSYIPNLAAQKIPILCLDQEEKALVHDLVSPPSSGSIYFAVPQDPHRLALYESIVFGDSGNPAFMIINNQLVILTVWTGGGAGSGSEIVPNKLAINAIISAQGYQLTEMDISGFAK